MFFSDFKRKADIPFQHFSGIYALGSRMVRPSSCFDVVMPNVYYY
jgi:hypothetical protein